MVVVVATHCSIAPPIRYSNTPVLHYSNFPILLSPALSLPPDGGKKRSLELQCETFAAVLDLGGPRLLKNEKDRHLCIFPA
jgi:hypothetical protein